MIVNLVWPRTAIYDLEGDSSLLQWSAIITIGMTLAFGGAHLWWRRRTHGAIVLAPIPITITAKVRGADAETPPSGVRRRTRTPWRSSWSSCRCCRGSP